MVSKSSEHTLNPAPVMIDQNFATALFANKNTIYLLKCQLFTAHTTEKNDFLLLLFFGISPFYWKIHFRWTSVEKK